MKNKPKVGEKKYFMLYRETAFGEEKESGEVFTLAGLRTLFKHYPDNVVKVHKIIEL